MNSDLHITAPARAASTEKPHVYFENLNGLRFLCFLSVFFYHSFFTENEAIRSLPLYYFVKTELFGNGYLGVNFFFVLSGFLITYLLTKEKTSFGSVAILSFWLRRILRIWPLFYLCVAAGFIAFPLLKASFGQTANETANWVYYLTFLNNFDVIANGLPDASILGVLWSIAVEEQFYFLWPIAISVVPIRRLPVFFIALLIVSTLFRIKHPEVLYDFHTFSCMNDLVVGAFGAILIQHEPFRKRVIAMSKPIIASTYVVTAFLYFFLDELIEAVPIFQVPARTFVSFLFILIIVEQCYARNSLFTIKNLKWASTLGIISYGLYCLHMPSILIVTQFSKMLGWDSTIWDILILQTLLALCLTILFATMSYRFFEKPFLRFKSRFERVDTHAQ